MLDFASGGSQARSVSRTRGSVTVIANDGFETRTRLGLSSVSRTCQNRMHSSAGQFQKDLAVHLRAMHRAIVAF